MYEKRVDIKELVEQLPVALLCWYPFNGDATVLLVTGKVYPHTRILLDFLREKGLQVDLEPKRKLYSNIIVVEALECASSPINLLIELKGRLAEDGKLLLFSDNRLGLRYFCGDRDAYTNHSFDGIEDYGRISAEDRKVLEGRSYSYAELNHFLKAAGLDQYHFFSILPNLDYPQLIYREDYLPNEDLARRFTPMYFHPDSVFLEENLLYTSIIRNGMFHNMANSYMFEYSPLGNFTDIKHVTISMDRGKEQAMLTKIDEMGKVSKCAIYPEGQSKLKQMLCNNEDLRAHGIHVVDAHIEQQAYVMPYVEAITAADYLEILAEEDTEQFISEVDRFIDQIYQSSEHIDVRTIESPYNFPEGIELEDVGTILKCAYMDMVPLNCFYVDGEYVFYDQEFCLENYPVKAIIQRGISILYKRTKKMDALVPKQFFLERYGLAENQEYWQKIENDFIQKLRNQRLLKSFHEMHRADSATIGQNRERLNYSALEYGRLFKDIFKGTEGRKLVLFGSGKFAKRFIERFGNKHKIDFIIDNSENKWGQKLNGIPIFSVKYLEKMNPNEYKIIVCVKEYASILMQLEKIGAEHIAVFNPFEDFSEEEHRQITQLGENTEETKKYHIGYIAGVFDLFHVGHLNMFKRAKEQCEYLIVGVVSDEGVRKNKKVEPFVPFEERIEMVRSCRYVDEAVAIPFTDGSSREAFRRYHFDVQFSGSDYIDNPDWAATKTFLEKNGAELVFFPYTEQTSSTKIKALISQKLI